MTVILGIAYHSWKQLVRDRIFYIVLITAGFMVAFSYLLSTLTIIETRKILLDFGFSAASLAGVITATYVGVGAMAREVEQKLIYTIVSKPVSRAAYLLGKFLGSAAVLLATHVMLAVAVLFTLYFSGERSPHGFAACFYLIFLENLILLACAFFFSVFCSTLLAGCLTLAFFLIGRSNSAFLTLGEKGLTADVRTVGRVLYSVLPNLERFNIRDVVAYERPYPTEMLGLGLFYCVFYVLLCLAFSSWIFSKRDLP